MKIRQSHCAAINLRSVFALLDIVSSIAAPVNASAGVVATPEQPSDVFGQLLKSWEATQTNKFSRKDAYTVFSFTPWWPAPVCVCLDSVLVPVACFANNSLLRRDFRPKPLTNAPDLDPAHETHPHVLAYPCFLKRSDWVARKCH